MRIVLLITLLFNLFNACTMPKSQKKKATALQPLPQTHPLAGRKTLYSLENSPGEVITLDAANYAIRIAGDDKIFLPLNLPASFRKEGMKINFSGMVKEIDPTEFWAAHPLILTKIEK
jgi:hypothetical protein